MAGEDLSDTIERLGPIEPRHAARVVLQACEGLQAAHDKGLVHRDVKPANLFVHELPTRERVIKLCDFGIAKDVTSDSQQTSLTQTGGMLGSPMYMSPEQIKDAKSADLRTDIWSLGATLFHALSGIPPWAGNETVGALILAIHTDPLPELTDVAPWVDPGLDAIVRKAMQRKPEDRYPSMAAMAEDLRAYVGSSTSLERGLAAVSKQRRQERPAPAPLPPTVAATEVASPAAPELPPTAPTLSTDAGTSVTAADPPPRSRLAPIAIATVIGLGALGAGAYAFRGGGASASNETATEETASAEATIDEESSESEETPTSSDEGAEADPASEPAPTTSATSSASTSNRPPPMQGRPPRPLPRPAQPPSPAPPAPPPPPAAPPPPPAAPPPGPAPPSSLQADDAWR
jgi:serine/threonine-protein kinase